MSTHQEEGFVWGSLPESKPSGTKLMSKQLLLETFEVHNLTCFTLVVFPFLLELVALESIDFVGNRTTSVVISSSIMVLRGIGPA